MCFYGSKSALITQFGKNEGFFVRCVEWNEKKKHCRFPKLTYKSLNGFKSQNNGFHSFSGSRQNQLMATIVVNSENRALNQIDIIYARRCHSPFPSFHLHAENTSIILPFWKDLLNWPFDWCIRTGAFVVQRYIILSLKINGLFYIRRRYSNEESLLVAKPKSFLYDRSPFPICKWSIRWVFEFELSCMFVEFTVNGIGRLSSSLHLKTHQRD